MIILASASPRREALLRALWVEHRIIPSLVDEEGLFDGTTVGCAEALALRKATEVAARVEEGLILGADTIVECDGCLLGKPKDRDEARRFLQRLSGRSHQVITGLAIVQTGDARTEVGHEVTEVRMRALTDAEIDAYVRTGEPFDKAGGYAIQGAAETFIEGIKGSFTNVVGLPLGRLRALLLRFGIDPLERQGIGFRV
ncbi:septum formation protein [Candidatus Methylomirabilis lanthanidiphila]|uniref:dTTP/UTP pyrophosphatase n=1 Tax=Candidatus Methylomirabilis lanthanidiphila TaxID=2211376 RepID=A0A564ZME5_9BACT|nr:Maf family protein [Candidatus Methylomirabilis lanthanidiphila]VUZ86266.1 septum formation protein [Candidatus Methylomirabilis lanthanidiphila]